MQGVQIGNEVSKGSATDCKLVSKLVAIHDQIGWCMQGEDSDVMYIVESGVVTCHMDFLRLQHRMQLPAVSKDVLAVAPVRYSPIVSGPCMHMFWQNLCTLFWLVM